MSEDFYAPERVLVIVAHADDIEFGIAGTVARWTDAGTQVTYCIVTDSSSGSNDPDVDIHELIATRRHEQTESARIVGVEDVRFLNYPDGHLEPTMKLRKDLTRLIREIRPQVVVTLDPTTVIVPEMNYINHPDHRAVGEAALYATFPSAETRPIFRDLLFEGYEPHKVSRLYLVLSSNGHNNLVVDISTTMDRKLAALRCHQSQIDENAIEMVKRWSAETGKQVGLPYAETFRMLDFEADYSSPVEG